MLSKAFIPYGGYYSTPFARWQGSLANENAITLGAETSKRWLASKGWDPKRLITSSSVLPSASRKCFMADRGLRR